jgi:aminomethyltransferase
VLRVSGADAYDALDSLLPAELFLRDGQVLATLLLDDAAHPFADVYIGRDDRSFIILAEGLDAGALTAALRDAPGRFDCAVENLLEDRLLLSVDGPYAWEVVGELIGPEVLGLPYLSMFTQGKTLCIRAGKTGEYGYHLLVPRPTDAIRERLARLTPAFDLVETGLDALDRCALENWFFNIRREGRAEWATPLELQLQWRVSARKSFRGSAELARRRTEGPQRRLTMLASEHALALGDRIRLDDREVGSVVNAGASPLRGDWLALAFLDIAVALPGIETFHVLRDDASFGLRSVSPPALHNRSLFVSPQIHSYATRHESAFPPVKPARGG